MEMMSIQEAPQHLFDMSFSYLAQKKGVVLEILSFLLKMCKVDFFAFLDISQGLALRQEEQEKIFILFYHHTFVLIYMYLWVLGMYITAYTSIKSISRQTAVCI